METDPFKLTLWLNPTAQSVLNSWKPTLLSGEA